MDPYPRPVPAEPYVVVVGGTNLDVLARSAELVVDGSSNPGSVTTSPGGVGRNVAENLARLGRRVELVSVVGADDAGERVLAASEAAGVGCEHVRRGREPTGSYVAVLDERGELVVAVSAMGSTALLGPDDVDRAGSVLDAASLVVLDGNLPAHTIAHALARAARAGVAVALDPVSVTKAHALAGLVGTHPVRVVSPNLAELAALTGHDGAVEGDVPALCALLRGRGVEEAWVRLGSAGSLLCTAQGTTRHPALPVEVADVTGAGDAMLAAYCHDRLRGAPPPRAAAYAHAAAALTVASPHAVRPDLTDDLVRSLL